MSEPVWVPLGAQPPGGKELAYVERTTNLAVAATTEATAETFIASGVVSCDGQPIIIEFFAPIVEATQYCWISLWDGETNLGRWGNVSTAAGANENNQMLLRRKLAPTPGNHTFSVRVHRGTGSATVYAGSGGAGATLPAYLWITQEDVVANVVPVGAPPLVTALPASPVDGQEVILTDSLTAPTYSWRLRYVAAKATNKWLFIGGAPAMSEVAAQDSHNVASYVPLTGGPAITLPIAGIYDVEIGAFMYLQTVATTMFMSYDIGATGAVDADGIEYLAPAGNHSNEISRVQRKTLGAVTLTAKYRAAIGGGINIYRKRFMRVTPIAVGG